MDVILSGAKDPYLGQGRILRLRLRMTGALR